MLLSQLVPRLADRATSAEPTTEYAKGSGCDHYVFGFTVWVAGGTVAFTDFLILSKNFGKLVLVL